MELQWRVVMGIPHLFREPTLLVQLAKTKKKLFFFSKANPQILLLLVLFYEQIANVYHIN